MQEVLYYIAKLIAFILFALPAFGGDVNDTGNNYLPDGPRLQRVRTLGDMDRTEWPVPLPRLPQSQSLGQVPSQIQRPTRYRRSIEIETRPFLHARDIIIRTSIHTPVTPEVRISRTYQRHPFYRTQVIDIHLGNDQPDCLFEIDTSNLSNAEFAHYDAVLWAFERFPPTPPPSPSSPDSGNQSDRPYDGWGSGLLSFLHPQRESGVL